MITVGHMMGKRRGLPVEGWAGSMAWRGDYSGRQTMVLKFRTAIKTDELVGWVDLEHPASRLQGEGKPQAYRVHLEGARQPFGGVRWFFACPATCERAHKLFLPIGGNRFLSRQAYRLGYACQRETGHDRAVSRAWKARLALGGKRGENPLGSPLPKPKGKHWRTFDRDMARLKRLENVTTRHVWFALMRLQARVQRGC